MGKNKRIDYDDTANYRYVIRFWMGTEKGERKTYRKSLRALWKTFSFVLIWNSIYWHWLNSERISFCYTMFKYMSLKGVCLACIPRLFVVPRKFVVDSANEFAIFTLNNMLSCALQQLYHVLYFLLLLLLFYSSVHQILIMTSTVFISWADVISGFNKQPDVHNSRGMSSINKLHPSTTIITNRTLNN